MKLSGGGFGLTFANSVGLNERTDAVKTGEDGGATGISCSS